MRTRSRTLLGGLLGLAIATTGLVAGAAPAQAGVAYAYVPGASFANCEQQASRYMQRQGAAGYKAATRTTCAKNHNGIWVSKVTLSY